tara:strand:- start:23323 stop:23460 length:138 start_codon:yes stop_codon:yes gene_type:complete
MYKGGLMFWFWFWSILLGAIIGIGIYILITLVVYYIQGFDDEKEI